MRAHTQTLVHFPAEDLQRLLTELALEKDDVTALMAMADSDGDGVISFDEFRSLMQTTQRPNPITRVSMMSSISETTAMEVEYPSPASPGRGMEMSPGVSASPVNSLMNAMEAKWMSGRMPSLPRVVSKAIHMPHRKRQQVVH